MAESKESRIEQCLKGLIKKTDQMQEDMGQEVEKRNQRFEAQIQEVVKEQISKGIEDGMDRLEATVQRLFKLQVSSDKPNATKEIGKVGEVPVRNVVNEEIVANKIEGTNQYQGEEGRSGYLPDLPFPAFDVTDLVSWVWKCDIYFDLYQIAEHHKTTLAVLHFNDTATKWYRGEKGNSEHFSWNVLKEMLIERFKERRAVMVAEEWDQLSQTGSVKDYIEDFQVAKTKMLLEYETFSEFFFVNYFFCGLKEEIQRMVKVSDSTTLKDVFHQAIRYERYINAKNKKFHG